MTTILLALGATAVGFLIGYFFREAVEWDGNHPY